jgi:anti-sigma regulatory factor (Ser/Thr protein kinase)
MNDHVVQVFHDDPDLFASPRRFSAARPFGSDQRAAGRARRFVVDALRRRGWDEALIDAAGLAVTELATNAILHARSPFTVTLTADDRGVRIEVWDSARVLPRLTPMDPLGEHGRGLCLVEAVASRWGIDPEATGKVMWVELGR